VLSSHAQTDSLDPGRRRGVGAYNYSNGRDLLSLPGKSARALKNTVRETVGVPSARGARRVKEHASVGVHTAVNRAEDAVSSASLTPKIKAKMALDDLVKASDINVDTDGSVVTLTGTVASNDEQRRALRIATETAGVTKVVNHLRVR
jgi:osmotically-inducible protein OsmY